KRPYGSAMKWIAAIVLCFGMSLAAPQTVAAKSGHRKAPDPFVSGAPLTVEQVLKLATQEAIPLRRRKEAIDNRGVDFILTSEVLNKLKAAGAPDEFIDAVRAKARPAPVVAVIPKAPPTGGIVVNCAPVECEVAVNGTPRGATVSGVMELGAVPVG